MIQVDGDTGPARVIHAACDGVFEVGGRRVGVIRASVADALNVRADALAFVNGKWGAESYLLRPGDILEFCHRAGRKGVVRMLTEAEIRREYQGVPREVLDDLFARFPPDDTTGGGRLWLEPAVDDWLRERYARRRADDGRDRVIPPSGVRLGGRVYNDLTNQEWWLMEALLRGPFPGVRAVKIADVIEVIWGSAAEGKENALKQLLKRLNKRLQPYSVIVANGFVVM